MIKIAYLFIYFFSLINIGINSIVRKKIFIIFPFVAMALFAGLRYKVGTDYMSYIDIYNSFIQGTNKNMPSEPGYKLILIMVSSIGGGQQLIFLFFSAVSSFFMYKFIDNNSENKGLSLFIYLTLGTFFLSSMNVIRQYAAIALFAYSTKYIINRELKKYVLTILVGVLMFHFTLFLMLPFYFILNMEWNKKRMVLFLIAEIFFAKILQNIIAISPYKIYLTMIFDKPINIAVYFYMFMNIVIIFILEKFKKEQKVYYNMLFFSIALLSLIFIDKIFQPEIILRLNNYFFIVIMLQLPFLINRIKGKYFKIGILAFIYIFFSLYYFRTVFLLGKEYTLLPYNINLNLFNINN